MTNKSRNTYRTARPVTLTLWRSSAGPMAPTIAIPAGEPVNRLPPHKLGHESSPYVLPLGAVVRLAGEFWRFDAEHRYVFVPADAVTAEEG